MAAETPSGKDRSKVIVRVSTEPTTLAQMPANSGSRESPEVKNCVLKVV